MTTSWTRIGTEDPPYTGVYPANSGIGINGHLYILSVLPEGLDLFCLYIDFFSS